MFAISGICAKESRCTNPSHFIPFLTLSKGHHHLPQPRIRPQPVLALSLQNGQRVHFFPRTGRKEVFNIGHPVHVHCEIFKQHGIVQCKSGKKISCCHPQRLTLLDVGMCEYTRSDTRHNVLQLLFCSFGGLFIFQYSLVIALCQFIHIYTSLLSDYISIFMDICIRTYKNLFLPNPLLLHIWLFPYFFYLTNCN